MANNTLEFLTPVGRLVQGNPFVPNTKDMQGNPLVVKFGPNAGQPTQNYYVGLAIPKNDPGLADMWSKMQQAAQQGFPRGESQRQNFSWKFIDGDSVDRSGQPYANREGHAGCYIFKFSSSFAPKCLSAGGASVLTDPESIKRGYYIRVYGTTQGNDNQQNPGIYLNLGAVELVAYGEEIVSGPDYSAVFSGAPVAQLPPGATTTPPAPRTQAQHPNAPAGNYPPQPGNPPSPAYGTPPAGAPYPGQGQPPAPGYPPQQPQYTPTGAPPMPPQGHAAPPPPPPPAAPQGQPPQYGQPQQPQGQAPYMPVPGNYNQR